MKYTQPLFTLFLYFVLFYGNAQEDRNLYLEERLANEKKLILENEREALKIRINEVNEKLLNNSITPLDADSLKLHFAEESARAIEQEYLEKETELYQSEVKLKIKNDTDFSQEKIKYYGQDKRRHRVTNDLVFAIGLNQLYEENKSLENTPYDFIRSWFTELGWSWKTNLIPNSSIAHLRYGFSVQINTLSPKANKVFFNNGGSIELRPYDTKLKTNKLIYSNLVFPIHLEFGSRRRNYSIYNQNGSYTTNRYNSASFVVGGGLYGGFNLQHKMRLKGEGINEKTKPDLNFNDLIYGLSGYVSLPGLFTLYGKMDLSSVFKDQPVFQQNISLGFRFDIN